MTQKAQKENHRVNLSEDQSEEHASQDRFATEPMLPLIWSMALPSILAQIVNLLYSIVDRIYIGHIEGSGTMALAGVGVCNSVIILVSAFAQFVGGGGAPQAAYALGQGNHERAEKLLGNGFTLLLLFSMGTMALVYLVMTPLLYLTGASESTLPFARSYLSVYMTGTFFVQLTLGLNSFINCQGRAGVAMLSVIIGAVLNIVLDPVFIFVLDMGVAGAALATVISQAASCVFVLRFLTSPKAALRLKRKNFHLEGGIVRQILALGISPFVMSSTESLVGLVLNNRLVQFGDIYVSALTIMQSAMQFTSVPLIGFQQGASPVISYNYGHNDPGRVKEGFRVILAFMTIFTFVTTLFMILRPAWIAGIFTNDEELILVVSRMMPLFLSGMLIFGLQRACQCMFVALNQPRVSLFVALLRKVFLLVPLAFLLSIPFGYLGVYASEAIADATAAIICITIFANRFPGILAGMGK